MSTKANITISQSGNVLSSTVVTMERDGDLSEAIKAEVDKVRWQNRAAPLWGLTVSIDKPD